MNALRNRLLLSALTVSTLGLALSAVSSSTRAADIPLYPTGPAQDSSFVRFVTGTAQPVDVTASDSKARMTLSTAHPATPFYPIAAGKPVTGTLTSGQARREVSATVKPGEFVSIVALDKRSKDGAAGSASAKSADGLDAITVRESPDDFNALKASVAFYNLDARCAAPTLIVPGHGVVLLDGVAPGQSKRRQVNPVALSVQLTCGAQPVGQPVSLGTLVAGQRYTVFLVPGGTQSRLFFANDAVAR